MLGANLNYGEEMHQSRILGAWSNMIGYEMRFFTVWGFILRPRLFKGRRTSSMVVNTETLFVWGVL